MVSKFEVEGESERDLLDLRVSDDGPEAEATGEGGGDAVVELVLEEGVHVAIVVYLHLARGLVVELVGQAEGGLAGLGLVVECELGADGLGGASGVVHIDKELAELHSLGIGRLVLQAEDGASSRAPVEAEVVLLEGRGLRVEDEVATERGARLSEVAEGEISEECPKVEEELRSSVGTDVLEATLELGGLAGSGDGPRSAIKDEAEALGVGEFLSKVKRLEITSIEVLSS